MELTMSMEELYMFLSQDMMIAQPRMLYRLDSHSEGRYYYRLDDNGCPIFYPSNTTFCGRVLPTPPFLIDWFKDKGAMADMIRDASAAYGTLLHICQGKIWTDGFDFDNTRTVVEAYLKAQGIPLVVLSLWAAKINKAMASYIQFIIDKNVKPIAAEIMLSSDQIMLATTIDLICELDFNRGRKRAYIDTKSGGAYESSGLQLTIGKRIWEDNYPEIGIDMLFNWVPVDWKDKPTYKLVNQTDTGYDDETLDLQIKLYNKKYKNDIEDKRVYRFFGKVSMGNLNQPHFAVETMSEHVKQSAEYPTSTGPEIF